MKAIRTLLAALSNRMRWLFSIMGRVPALAYLLGYLITIFVFSLIYLSFSFTRPGKHFQNSTDPTKYLVIDYPDPIMRDLRDQLIQEYRSNGQANQVVDGWRMVTDDIEVSSLYTANLPAMFSFQVLVPVNHGTEGNGDNSAYVKSTVTVYTDGRLISNDIVYLPFQMENIHDIQAQAVPSQIPNPGMQLSYVVDPLFGVNLKPVVPSGGGDVVQPMEAPYLLPLSTSLYNQIVSFSEAPRGLSSLAGAGYLQMLYLSAGIATSNTPAGITPVSPEAQETVGAEGIIAVIFIGLFLNSLAYDIGKGLENTQKLDPKTNRIVSTSNKKRPTKRSASGSQAPASQKGSPPPKNRATRKNPRPATHR
jgi:hypothetical protein